MVFENVEFMHATIDSHLKHMSLVVRSYDFTLLFFYYILLEGNNGDVDMTIVVYWVTDGVDWCQVGFLQTYYS